MMMDPSKDYYEQRLAAHAHQAWAAAAAYHNPAAQHYMQRIQQFLPPSSSNPQVTATASPYSARAQHTSNFSSENIKEHVYSGNPPLNSSVSVSGNSYPPGHPMHFPGMEYHQSHNRASPTPAHSGNGNVAPLPAHRGSPSLPKVGGGSVDVPTGHVHPPTATGSSSIQGPLPAHMRSNPYQPTTNYHNLNSSYHPPPSQFIHHPSYLPPTGAPSTNSSHYPPTSMNPPNLTSALSSNSSTMPISNNIPEPEKLSNHREFPEQLSSKLPSNDPRSLSHNGGVHLSSSRSTSYSGTPNQRPSDGHNYNNNYNSSATPEDFSNRGRSDSRSSRKDSSNPSNDSPLGDVHRFHESTVYSKQHSLTVPTTSNSSPHTYSPYTSSHYSNIPPATSIQPPTNLSGNQSSDSSYGNAYSIPNYASQRYTDRLDSSPHQQPPAHHPHSSGLQTIVQPRGPTIDASNQRYSGSPGIPSFSQPKNNLGPSNVAPVHNQLHDDRRHHHSSGNSSGASDEHHRASSSYGNQSSNQYSMPISNVAPPGSTLLPHADATNASTTNPTRPPVTGHPYLPQNIPFPPPDAIQSHQQNPPIQGSDIAHSVTSQLSNSTYPKPDANYGRSEQPSAYGPNHRIPAHHEPNPSSHRHQHELTTLSNRGQSSSPSGLDLQQSLITQAKEKSQSGSWKRKHSFDGKKVPNENRQQSKKSRLSLEGKKLDKTGINSDDPYLFDDDIEKSSVGSNSNSNSGVEFARFSANGRQGCSSSGPVYKFKSALLSREQSKSNTPEPPMNQSHHFSGVPAINTGHDNMGESSSRNGSAAAKQFVALNSKCVPLRFDASDNNFSGSCEELLNDLVSKPISVSRRPSIENWKSAMAARAEKKADKRKAKELRKELAAEKAAALEKALVEKGSVVPANVKGAAELRDAEKRQESSSNDSFSHNEMKDNRAAQYRVSDDKKSQQHVTFSTVPPVQYPSIPPSSHPSVANTGYTNPSHQGYAMSNVPPPAMQIPAFQPQPQYYSTSSHALSQNPSTNQGVNSSGQSSISSSPHPSAPSSSQASASRPTPRHAPLPPNKQGEKRFPEGNKSDQKYPGKSKLLSTVPSHLTDPKMAGNEDQKENRPKKTLSSNRSPMKGDSSKNKLDKKPISSSSSSKNSQTQHIGTTKSLETKKNEEQRMAKEKENTRRSLVNGNTSSLEASNDLISSDKKIQDALGKPKVKKGTLWAMPIVPKLPQKPNDKRSSQNTSAAPATLNSIPATKKSDTLISGSRPFNKENKQNKTKGSAKGATSDVSDSATGNGTGAIADVWRQAFGAVKPNKPVEISPLKNKLLIKQEIDAETCKKITYLDIPPEVRRRPKPSFGGLIHFPPDWERAVKRHHEKCRLPNQLIKGIKANPQILCKNNIVYDSKQLSPVGKDSSASMSPPFSPSDSKYTSLSSYLGNPDNYSPPKTETSIYGDKRSSASVLDFEKEYPYLLAKNKKSESMGDSFDLEEKLLFGANSVVDNILLNRKRLRGDGALGRMYRVPFSKEKRKRPKNDKIALKSNSSDGDEDLGIMPTPGLPLLTADTTEVLMTTGNFGNFRRQTLLRYLDSLNNVPDLKAKLLDWKPEVFETKTRRQSNQVKAVTSYREIFGIDLPKPDAPTVKRGKDIGSAGYKASPPTSGTSTPTKKLTKKEKEKIEQPSKPEKQKTPTKKSKKLNKDDAPHNEEVEDASELVEESGNEKEIAGNTDIKKDKKDKKAKPVKQAKESPVKSKKKDENSSKKDIKKADKDLDIATTPESIPIENNETNSTSNEIIEPIPSTTDAPIKVEKLKLPKMPRKTKKQLKLEAEARARGELSDDDNYEPTEEENQLQDELQNYALDLLETNKSWERRRVIQNLVIWEAVDPIPLTKGAPLKGFVMAPTDPLWQRGVASLNAAGIVALAPPPTATKGGKRKSKKFKKRSSGLDFVKRKSNNNMPSKTSSRETSRASSPTPGNGSSHQINLEPLTEVTHSLDHVVNEGRHWVINKSAGETILHRAAKQGLPDIAAYALSMGKMSPTVKDNGGIPPIHKAAFHGHHKIVELLLKFGSDPNTNVKGTRPLHEALEGGSRRGVHQLLSFGSDPMLYDYSGNMPIDLAEGNEDMHEYFGSVLADLHGKESKRWNISNNLDFTTPDLKICDKKERNESFPIDIEETFQLSHQPLPAYYRIGDKPGKYALNVDLRKFTSIDFTRGTGACSRFEVLSMSKEDFIRTARCCLLGHKPNISASVNPHDGKIYLVKVDSYLQKIMGVES